MPVPIERIKSVEDEIVREAKVKKEDAHIYHHDSDDDDDNIRHTTAMTPPDQDFSFLTHSANNRRTVHYDDQPANDHECRPLRKLPETDQPSVDNVLRRRYIAHWGLPGTVLTKGHGLYCCFFLK